MSIIIGSKLVVLNPYNTCYNRHMSVNLGENERLEIISSLESLGLNEKESLVYLALVQTGETGSSNLSRATDLHTQFIYQALESLEKVGLAQHVIRRGRKKFSAKHPQSLVRHADQQRRTAESVATILEKLTTMPKEQRFEVFQGRDSYVAHEFDFLKETPADSEILIISGDGDRFLEEMGDLIREYEKIRLKKQISVRYVGSRGQQNYLASNSHKRELFSYRLLPGLFTGQVSTDIWPSAIGFNIYGSPVMSFVVSNEVIAGSYRQFFETLWKLGSI